MFKKYGLKIKAFANFLSNFLPHSAHTNYTLHMCPIWIWNQPFANKRYVRFPGEKRSASVDTCMERGVIPPPLPLWPPFLTVSGRRRPWMCPPYKLSLCCIHFNPISTIVTVIPYCSNFSRLLSLPQTCQQQRRCPVTPPSRRPWAWPAHPSRPLFKPRLSHTHTSGEKWEIQKGVGGFGKWKWKLSSLP